jgi:hypothetical protein
MTEKIKPDFDTGGRHGPTPRFAESVISRVIGMTMIQIYLR